MTGISQWATIVLAFSVLWVCPGATAQSMPRISEPSYLDRQYMQQQRALLGDLAERNFGRGFSGNTDSDLALLQQMLDQRLVRSDQTRELQAMGIVMGDLLAADLDLHWVIYEDRLGRSRALRYRLSEEYLFPVTMISRRQEAGNSAPVTAIYQKAHAIMSASKPPLPFQ